MRVVVTMMPLCRVDAARLHAGELLHVGNDKAERVPVEEIAMQCLGKEEELSALSETSKGGDTDPAAELVRSAGFALAVALDLRRM